MVLVLVPPNPSEMDVIDNAVYRHLEDISDGVVKAGPANLEACPTTKCSVYVST